MKTNTAKPETLTTGEPTHGLDSIENELAPCPFCGSSSKVVNVGVELGDPEYAGRCEKCFTVGPSDWRKEVSIADWNRRLSVGKLREWILNSPHCGHHEYCAAVRGPDNENWYEHERCDCGRNKLLETTK